MLRKTAQSKAFSQQYVCMGQLLIKKLRTRERKRERERGREKERAPNVPQSHEQTTH